ANRANSSAPCHPATDCHRPWQWFVANRPAFCAVPATLTAPSPWGPFAAREPRGIAGFPGTEGGGIVIAATLHHRAEKHLIRAMASIFSAEIGPRFAVQWPRRDSQTRVTHSPT